MIPAIQAGSLSGLGWTASFCPQILPCTKSLPVICDPPGSVSNRTTRILWQQNKLILTNTSCHNFFSKGWWFAVEQGPPTELHDLYCTVLQREESARVFLGLLFPGGGSWDASVRAQRWSPSAVLLSHTASLCRGQANPCQIHQVFCRRNKLRTFWCLISDCTVYSEAFPLNIPSEGLTRSGD